LEKRGKKKTPNTITAQNQKKNEFSIVGKRGPGHYKQVEKLSIIVGKFPMGEGGKTKNGTEREIMQLGG